MDRSALIERGPGRWEWPACGHMKVPVIACASAALLREMDDQALAQAVNVAC